jgi:hypothetical protein
MTRHRITLVAALMLLTSQGIAQTENPARPDWITATNQPCKIWNPAPQPNEAVTWSGECMDGYASGRGLLRWTVDGKLDATYEGQYANGKRNGHGVLKTADGRSVEGEWVNDQLLSGDKNAI